jgi:CspA family cold shock protein
VGYVGRMAVLSGKVVRFDQVKGYGFNTPDTGDEDIFLHVNDLMDDKHLVRPGVVVEFEVEDGDRGPKASGARIVQGAHATGQQQTRRTREDTAEFLSDGTCEILTADAYRREVTEALLASDPALSGAQILRVREAMLGIGRAYGWIED